MHNTIAIKCLLVSLLLLHSTIDAKGQGKRYVYFVQSYVPYKLEDTKQIKDSSFYLFTKQYEDSIVNYLNEKIIFSEKPLTKAQPESSMGNWIADATKTYLSKKTKLNICLISYNSIGLEYLSPGAITRKDFYDILPNQNKLLLFHLSGKEIERLCDTIALLGGMPLSGISFTIKEHKATNILVNNLPLNEHLVYSVATDDNMLSNKKFSIFFKGQKFLQLHDCLRQLLVEYSYEMKSLNKNIQSTMDKRISYAE